MNLAERHKQDFPLFMHELNLIYLDNAATTQKPQSVIDAVNDFYTQSNANIHRGVYSLSQKATEAYEDARQTVADFINAPSAKEIVFTAGTTESINLIAAGFEDRIQPEDEILITEMEHHANLVPWQQLCEKTGAELKVAPVTDSGEIDLDALCGLLSDKTKLAAVTHVSNTLGTVNPVKNIIDAAHERDIPVLVDGAQAVPHLSVDVQDLDADFYVFSGHKLYGPSGIGVLYAKQDWLEALPPYQTGGDMIRSVTFEETTFAEAPQKFEAGTPNIAGAVGLVAAINYVQTIGMETIAEHERALTDYAKQELAKIERLRFIGNTQDQAGIISFVIDGIHPHDIGTILDQHNIAIRAGHHCTQPLMERFGVPATSRVSFSVYNSFEDIDKLVDGLQTCISILR